jgi:dihydroorotate dehydrogenase (fumarate)
MCDGSMANISGQLEGVQFRNVFMNASGARCTSKEDLHGLGNSTAGAIVIKSTTFQPREGNALPRYFHHDLGSINSTGLANPGYEEYCKWIPELKEHGKPIISSIAGFSKDEYVTMAQALEAAGADILEINLSCPNVVGKPQVGYECDQSEAVLSAVKDVTKKPVTVKLPPYFDIVHREQIAAVLKDTRISGITLVNSMGNALIVNPDTERAAIKPKHGLGGLGGKYIKPITLGNVFSFHQLMGKNFPIFGCGGIYSGMDAFEHFLCGAQFVQVGTHYQEKGAGIFETIQNELHAIMEQKGYNSIEQFRGKLKPLE